MKRSILLYAILLIFISVIYSCTSSEEGGKTFFDRVSKAESAVPIHPGIPGERPFWNTYAKRFIYAPAFDFKKVEHADKYLYKISGTSDSMTYSFENEVPYAALSPVWSKIPVGYFNLDVIGVTKGGDSVGLAGEGRYYRAAWFKGTYHKAVMPYDSSAMLALSHLMHKDYVNYWLVNKKPDPDYELYRYPAKMCGSLISGAVIYAQLVPDTNEAIRAIKIAEIVADYLLNISFPRGSAWEYFPPTYYGEWIQKLKQAPWIKLDNLMPVYGASVGDAYLDLYDLTGDKRYLRAAERIAQTFVKRQLKNGSWNLYVNPKTGEPYAAAENVAIPTAMLSYFDRLKKGYKMEGLDSAARKAFSWIMHNPVKTYKWKGQYEDMGTHKPYSDLTGKEAWQFANYLFGKYSSDSNYIKIAEDLVRFSEDQFVIWEKPRLWELNGRTSVTGRSSKKGSLSTNWITPCAQEQYLFWMPTSSVAMLMAGCFRRAYIATHKRIYLAKAKSLANSLTIAQKYHKGTYPSYFTKYRMTVWLNITVLDAAEMIALANIIKELKY